MRVLLASPEGRFLYNPAFGLMNQKSVWPRLGYEGSSFEKGGYRHRGFDDIDWLPAPGADTMRTFKHSDNSVVVVIGSGAGGGTAAAPLATGTWPAHRCRRGP
jgi:hypothetical protein